MNMAGYVAPAGAVVPDPTPITLPGYAYVSDDGSLVNGGTNVFPVSGKHCHLCWC